MGTQTLHCECGSVSHKMLKYAQQSATPTHFCKEQLQISSADIGAEQCGTHTWQTTPQFLAALGPHVHELMAKHRTSHKRVCAIHTNVGVSDSRLAWLHEPPILIIAHTHCLTRGTISKLKAQLMKENQVAYW